MANDEEIALLKDSTDMLDQMLTQTITPSRRRTNHVRSSSVCGNTTAGETQRIRERLLRTQSTPRPSTIRNLNRSQRLALFSLAIVELVSFCSMSIMAPFFPKEANAKGMSEFVSGLVFSFYALAMFLSAPVFGSILPRVGARFLLISGLTVSGTCNVLFGLLDYMHDYRTFVAFCFIIRGLEALGASAFSTASYIFVVDIFPDNVGAVLGILETFVGFGMSIGPAIGGLLYSIGGFPLPFYVLGGILVLVTPINFYLLPLADDCRKQDRKGSIRQLIKLPAVLVIGSVVVVASTTWSFLDPTLEPHLRQFNLSTKQVGLVFLLFSALYGICSPIWGSLADRTNSHWSMMVIGLILSSVGLAILGPSAFLPFLPNALWLNILGLCTLGVSVSLTLLPTFQSILASAISGGCPDQLSTYSTVAGLWACVYSLGEVIGPSLGGFLLERYDFPTCSTFMGVASFVVAIITMLFFCLTPHNAAHQNGNAASQDSGILSYGSLSTSTTDSVNPDERTSLRRSYEEHDDHVRKKAERFAELRLAQEYGSDDCVDWEKEVTDFRGTIGRTNYGACEV